MNLVWSKNMFMHQIRINESWEQRIFLSFSPVNVSYRASGFQMFWFYMVWKVKLHSFSFKDWKDKFPSTHLNETRKPRDIECNLKLQIYNQSEECDADMKQGKHTRDTRVIRCVRHHLERGRFQPKRLLKLPLKRSRVKFASYQMAPLRRQYSMNSFKSS